MTGLIEIGLSNVAMAALLAIVAATVGCCLRKPALTHALWLLVLVKLITPPLIAVPVLGAQESGVGNQESGVRNQNVDDEPMVGEIVGRRLPPPPALAAEIDNAVAEEVRPGLAKDAAAVVTAPLKGEVTPKPPPVDALAPSASLPWLLLLQWTWLAGAVGLAFLAFIRVGRFQHLLRLARSAPDELAREARQLAKCLHVRCPAVFLLDGVVAPMVWVMGWKSRLLLPADLLGRLSAEQRSALLAHELAHLRRRDPWVRYLEMAVMALYWWCPLVWWARHELREAEEECCDAWVLWAMPGSARAYALALVETVDFLAEARPRLPVLASGFGHVHLLRRRLTMIMRGNTPRALSALGAMVVLGVAALALPLLPGRAVEAQEPAKEKKVGKGDPRTEEVRMMAKRLQEMRAQLEKDQDALRHKQMELEKHFRNLHEAMEKLGIAPAEGWTPFRRGEGQPQPRDPRRGDPQPGGGGLPGTQPRPGGGFPGGIPGTPPAQPGHGPQPPDFRGPDGGPGRGRPDMERRLGELERILQQALHEIKNLRRDLGPRGPGGNDPAGSPGRAPGGQYPRFTPSPNAPARPNVPRPEAPKAPEDVP